MDELAASGDAPELAELPPSKLGTRDHWDEASRAPHRRAGSGKALTGTTNAMQVYEREVKMFKEIGGDEGEVWCVASTCQTRRRCLRFADRAGVVSDRFGEDSAQDMVEWAEEHFPRLDGRIIDGSSRFVSPSAALRSRGSLSSLIWYSR